MRGNTPGDPVRRGEGRMNKLLWIASSLIAMSALLSGCKIGTPCDTSADCDSESFCDVDFYCSDNRDYAGCFDTSDCPLSDQQCLDVTTTAGTNGTLCSMFCSSSAQCRPNLGFPGAC